MNAVYCDVLFTVLAKIYSTNLWLCGIKWNKNIELEWCIYLFDKLLRIENMYITLLLIIYWWNKFKLNVSQSDAESQHRCCGQCRSTESLISHIEAVILHCIRNRFNYKYTLLSRWTSWEFLQTVRTFCNWHPYKISIREVPPNESSLCSY